MEDTAVEEVAGKVLQKLGEFVETVEPDRLSPQAMKHITATLKDIRELRQAPQTEDGTAIRVSFGEPDWNG